MFVVCVVDRWEDPLEALSTAELHLSFLDNFLLIFQRYSRSLLLIRDERPLHRCHSIAKGIFSSAGASHLILGAFTALKLSVYDILSVTPIACFVAIRVIFHSFDAIVRADVRIFELGCLSSLLSLVKRCNTN